ncbi:hypothetical protein B0H10DRAFT_1960705 [Mycena sp. CBHHK59/15]|nr:hypothetical protein B0H10DRAFT_1960705 [Mycena sp. CBHHK59/15]
MILHLIHQHLSLPHLHSTLLTEKRNSRLSPSFWKIWRFRPSSSRRTPDRAKEMRAADDIADWVDTVLDDAASRKPAELEALVVASLKTARKEQNYRNSVLFAALADFYRWLPRMGHLRAALRVAKSHGRGPAFRRVLCAQARFFEANGALKPGYQGRQEKHNGLLSDEGFYMGVQRWLRTLDVGTTREPVGVAGSLKSESAN